MENKMSKPTIFFNTECINCETVNKEMIRIGGIIMCKKCFKSEFNTDNPVKKEQAQYLFWLEYTKNKLDKE